VKTRAGLELAYRRFDRKSREESEKPPNRFGCTHWAEPHSFLTLEIDKGTTPTNTMNDLSNAVSDQSRNPLLQYVQSMSPETIAHLSQPSPEVAKVMEQNIVGMLGALPSEEFNVSVTTSREDLGKLLVSAMMNGYFLNNAYQRMTFENSLQAVETSDDR